MSTPTAMPAIKYLGLLSMVCDLPRRIRWRHFRSVNLNAEREWAHAAVDNALEENQRVRELQAAVDRAHGALMSSAYVGGPSEREAWQTALSALGEVVTQHTGVNQHSEPASNDAPDPGGSPPSEQRPVRITGEQET